MAHISGGDWLSQPPEYARQEQNAMSDIVDSGEENIIDEPLSEALSKRYLAYALSTITSRALPDVRDGLKPVQR